MIACLQTESCFPFPMGDKKHRIFVCGLFVHITPTEHEQELNLFENSLYFPTMSAGVY